MNPIWKTAIKVTGAVGVVGFLFSGLMKYLFQEEIINLLGSDRVFYIIIMLICIFGISIVSAIIIKNSTQNGSGSPKVIYKDNSTHKGDNKL